jgi:hypothetical protein
MVAANKRRAHGETGLVEGLIVPSEIASLPEWPVLRAWLDGKNPTGLAADLMEVEVASIIRELERLRVVLSDISVIADTTAADPPWLLPNLIKSALATVGAMSNASLHICQAGLE